MHFKVTARAILQLGSELISSDAIAFYELIKNAFDAGSKTVTVRIVVRIPHGLVESCLEQYQDYQHGDKFDLHQFNHIKAEILKRIDFEAPFAEELKKQLLTVQEPIKLQALLNGSNYISIEDQGEGMSENDLEEIYLTIGTRHRKIQRDQNNNKTRPILGEKGLGRLSVMRLGDGLQVETTQTGETHYNLLEIDWTIFSHDSDALLESISLSPKKGRAKSNILIQGTIINISSLRSNWTKEKLEDINKSQLSRFIDPFGKKNRDFIKLWFNKDPVILESMDKVLFQYAHATANALLEFEDDKPVFHGEVFYKTYDRQKTFSLAGTHLASVLKTVKYKEILKSLGPFTVELYWYNRQLLRESEGVLEASYIKKLVETWGGGLMLYRDGFRVNPYGGPGDDWLKLDPRALASPGYKLNRKQVVGKVDITSIINPLLLDQTNREGLRDNPEKQTLIDLLQYFIWDELKTFLDEIKSVEEGNIAALSLSEIEKRVHEGQNQVRSAIELLKRKYPQIKQESDTLLKIEEVLDESADLFRKAKASADVLNDRLKTTIDLAGLGLMVDVIAHELQRSTEYALKTISTLTANDLPIGVNEHMDTLRLQLKTLQTRLKVIDPLGPSGRQQKTLTDVRKLIVDTLTGHQAQLKRHNIQLVFIDKSPHQDWKQKIVPGMLVQVIENLLTNSIYWIKQEQILHNLNNAQITIELNRKEETITFSDNGPGVPRSKREDIFRPFFSTKPPGAGKGLGLYISREIAKYHNASLILVDYPEEKNLHEFLLDLKANKP